MTEPAPPSPPPAPGETAPIHRLRLFVASCMALVATSVAFATIGAALNPLKVEFGLTNAEVGTIGGTALWGFAISILLLGPLVDRMGMKNQLRLALACHLVGPLLMMAAPGFWTLFAGALVIALGNGAVEAVCNPLVATLYPRRKTAKLNQFHVWFPGGIVIGGVGAYLLTQQFGLGDYRYLLGLNLVPAVIYGLLMLGQRFPLTERVSSGVSDAEMVRATLLRPLFWLLLLCMAMTASLELGPGRWIPAVLEAGGFAGVLVLAYGNGLMAVLRFFAGPVVERVPPLLLLTLSAIVGGLGLLWFTHAAGRLEIFAAATVFYVGVCYFWPTMLGVTSERIPNGGALALAMMGATGMLVVGGVTSPAIGTVIDEQAHERLNEDPRSAAAILRDFRNTLADDARTRQLDPDVVADGIRRADRIVEAYREHGQVPPGTADVLRRVIDLYPGSTDAERARALLDPAENDGGRLAFRLLTPLAAVLAVIFLVLYWRLDRPKPARAEAPASA